MQSPNRMVVDDEDRECFYLTGIDAPCLRPDTTSEREQFFKYLGANRESLTRSPYNGCHFQLEPVYGIRHKLKPTHVSHFL
jgi:hypothetical protein